MSQVKVYHKTEQGCIYKCKSCNLWHVIYKQIQLNLTHAELEGLFYSVEHEVLTFNSDSESNQISPLYFKSENQGILLLNFLIKEYYELEFLLGGTLIIHETEYLLDHA